MANLSVMFIGFVCNCLALIVKVLEVASSYHISLTELQAVLSFLYTGQNQIWVRGGHVFAIVYVHVQLLG